MNYTSCNWIQHGLSFEKDHIEMCCLCCHKGGGRLYIKEDYNGKNLSWEEIFELKEKFIEENKKGIINPKCEGCFCLDTKDWDEDKYINYLHFDHWTHCNSDCIYCYTQYNKKENNAFKNYKVMPMLKEMFKRNLFNPNGEVTFAGGEPTILNEFDDIVNSLIKHNAKRITIHSSGIKYSKAIEKGIKEKVLTVCLSADSSTREMYKKVKRVDKFNDFWKNTQKYAKCQDKDCDYLVTTKYILIPGVNDNKEEIDGFFDLNLKNSVRAVTFDIENEYCKALRDKNEQKPQQLIDLCAYMIEKANEYELHTTFYNNFKYTANENNLGCSTC